MYTFFNNYLVLHVAYCILFICSLNTNKLQSYYKNMETVEHLAVNIKRIQQSNYHVQKIIESAQNLIRKRQLPQQQKQKMEVKISIQKQHLSNIFYNICTDQRSLKLQISDYCTKTPQNFKISIHDFKESNSPKSYSINYKSFSSPGQQKYSYLNKNFIKQNQHIEEQTKITSKYYQNLSEKSFSKITTYSERNNQNQKQHQVQTKVLQKAQDQYNMTTPTKSYQISKQEERTKCSVLKQNSQKLQSLEKKKYTIHIDRLNKKKQQEKKRINSKSNSKISSLSPASKLYSSALKHRDKGCVKCKQRSIMVKSCKDKQSIVEGFDLAKKYLTEQGQQECFNFLRSTQIPQAEWGSYITEYVYRQLSKVYNFSQRQSLKNSRATNN